MTLSNNSHAAIQLLPGITGVIGPNGAGKTHLLRSLSSDPRTALGFTTSDMHFFGSKPLHHFKALVAGWPELDLSSATNYLDFKASTPLRKLSVGQRQSVINAAVLNSGKEILLMDEPFNGLDAEHRAALREHIIDLAHPSTEHTGRTIVLTSQHADDLAGTVEHIVTVHDRIVSTAAQVDELRREFTVLTGYANAIDNFAQDCQVVESQALGPSKRIIVRQQMSDKQASAAERSGLNISYLDNKQLIELISSSAPLRSTDKDFTRIEANNADAK